MRRYLPDLRSNRIESHHQEMVLFSREFCRFLPAPWPGEAPGFKALIEEKKAVAFPVERFDSVGSPAAEQEQRVGTRVKPELFHRIMEEIRHAE